MSIDWNKVYSKAVAQTGHRSSEKKVGSVSAPLLRGTSKALAPVPAASSAPQAPSAADYDKEMARLQELRRQAAVDMDMDAVNAADNAMKELRAQAGKQTFGDRAGDVVGAAAAGTVGNIANAVNTVQALAGKKDVDYRLADIAAEDSQQFTQSAKEGLGAVGQFAVDAGVSGLQLLGDAAASALVPGAGLAVMGARSFGSGAQEARQSGASVGQQALYGLGSAATSVLTEKLSNVSRLFGKTFGAGVLDKAISKLTAKPMGKLVASALSEGGEEFLEAAVQPMLKKLTYEPDAAYDADWLADALYSAAVGGVLGGFGGGVDVAAAGKAQDAAQPSADLRAAERTGVSSPEEKTPVKVVSAPPAVEGQETTQIVEQEAAENQNTAPEVGAVTVRSGQSAINERNRSKNTLAYTLATSIDKVSDMEPVSRLTGMELNDRAKKPSEQIAAFFKSLGNKVVRAGFGDVSLGEYGVGGMLNHRPLNRAKMLSLAAVPDVIQNGRQIGYTDDWKGRGYKSYIFAAPVKVGGADVYVAAVVDQRPDNKFYLSEMVDSEGNYVRIDEESPSGNSKNGVTEGAELASRAGITAGPEGLSGKGTPSKLDTAANAAPNFTPETMEPVPSVNPTIAHPSDSVNMTEDERALRAPDLGDKNTVFAENEASDAPRYLAAPGRENDVRSAGERVEEVRRLPTAEEAVRQSPLDTMPAKAQQYLQKTERNLLGRIGDALSVPKDVQRDYLQKTVREISEEYMRTGTVSRERIDALFDEAYKKGVQVDTEFYDQHRHIKDMLRTRAVSISAEDQANIEDYGDFRKGAFGTLRISKDGTPVDVLYGELSELDPNLFPADITHPADQLVRMYEVGQSIRKIERTLDEYYGEDAGAYRAWAKRDFEDAVNSATSELNRVRRYTEEQTAKRAAVMTYSPEAVKAAYQGIKQARRIAEKAVARNLLTDYDNAQVSRLLKGEITLENLDPKQANVKGIKAVYEAKQEYEKLASVIREYRKQHSQKLRNEADSYLETANSWEDKSAGILYSRETMERNIRDIVPDRETADRIIQKYFKPVHDSQAVTTRAKNDYRNRVRKLGLSQKPADGNKISEAAAVQLLGEAEDNIRVLQESEERNAKRDGKTLQEWQSVVQELWEENPKLDREKIAGAVQEFRGIYDELFEKMNETLLRNGYEPMAYRQGYFPHFQSNETGMLAMIGTALGIQTDVTNLPTTINGLTHTFKPGKSWFGHALERKGVDTDYDALQGFDKYIEGAADVIYQTDNIQRLRALASQIRYRTSDDGLREQVDAVRARQDKSEDEKNAEIDKIYEDGHFTLANFVVELEEYTNLLANKKSRHDRNMEQALGRRMYNIVKGLESRVAANMVAFNPASWITNFIPIMQGAATLDSKSLMRGMLDTIQAYREDDGMAEVSSFLTNRRGSNPLVRTWAQDLSARLCSPMEYIDNFTADTLVRARYHQNLDRGLSVSEALSEADSWAAGVMADRSKGAMPTLFNRANPLTKLFTQFQLEVNNQFSYLFKDVPDELKERGAKALAAGLLKMFVGSWLFNEVYEYFIGRRPALDPLGILNDTVGDISGYKLSNLMEFGASAEKPLIEKTEKKHLAGTVKGLAGNIAEELPFMSALNLIGVNVDAGRIPVSNAIPDINKLVDAVGNSDWAPEKRWYETKKELAKPIFYLAPPVAGGQIKKVLEGVKAIVNGGSYSVNSAGEDILQYPVYNDTAAEVMGGTAKAMLFGKSALSTAQNWVASGFDSSSVKETAAYRGMKEVGVSGKDAYALLQELGSIQKTDEESAATLKRKVLRQSQISGEGKSVVFYGMMASDKEREIMDGVPEGEISETTDVLMKLKDANVMTGTGAYRAKRTALAEADLSFETKARIYEEFISAAKQDAIEEVLGAGLTLEDWLRFENDTAGLSSDDTSTKKEKVMDIIDGMDISVDQKNAMYLAAGYKESTLDDAPWSWAGRYALKAPALNMPSKILRLPAP